MSTFRILNQLPVYFDLAGNPASGGEIRFYESGTTTPKSVYADPDKSVDNGSTVEIGSDGRTVVDVWGDGSYRIRLYAADGTLVGEADDVEIPGGSATTIPTLVSGYFLTNNGSVLLWAEVRQMPDPTGQDGKVPVADGSGYVLQSLPEPEPPDDPDIVVGTDSFQAGVSTDETKWLDQIGTGSSTASGGKTATASITFDTEFAAAPCVIITPTTSSACSAANLIPSWAVTGVSTTGFTVTFSTVTGGTSADNFSGSNILSAVTFMWRAVGTVEVPAA